MIPHDRVTKALILAAVVLGIATVVAQIVIWI